MRVLVGIMLCASLLAGERENEPENWEYDQVTGERKMPRLEGEFPFLASVLNYRDNARCLGALIEPGVVLTAAHCVEPSRDVTVIVGRHLRDSTQVEVHPSYRSDDKFNRRSDVAKIYFDGPIPGVDPVSFHTDVLAGDIGVSVDRLYKVPVEVHSSGRVIRAGSPEGYVVKGDSGGPLLFWTLKGWAQAGVVSEGSESGWGFYVDTTHPEIQQWIDPSLEEESPDSFGEGEILTFRKKPGYAASVVVRYTCTPGGDLDATVVMNNRAFDFPRRVDVSVFFLDENGSRVGFEAYLYSNEVVGAGEWHRFSTRSRPRGCHWEAADIEWNIRVGPDCEDRHCGRKDRWEKQ